MRKIFKNLITLEEAENIFYSKLKISLLTKFESIDLFKAVGRMISESVISSIDIPPFDRATYDGFAVIGSDTFGADEESPVELKVKGHLLPGDIWKGRLQSQQAIEISTGAVMPSGANAVIMVEETQMIKKNQEIIVKLFKPVAPNDNISSAGSDIAYGETIVYKNTLITPRETSLLAAVGIQTIKVIKKPRVAIISTGTEIQSQKFPLDAGKIYDINTQTIFDGVIQSGAEPIIYGIFPDDFDSIQSVLNKALLECELITISGGTSAGMGDIIYEVINSLGSPGILCHGIRLAPGKPTILAMINFKPIIGLPGYPTSALMVFDLIVTPLINKILRSKSVPREILVAKTPVRLQSIVGRKQFLLVSVTKTSTEYPFVFSVPGGSGAISTLSRAHGYVIIPEDQQFIPKNSQVDVHLLVPKSSLPEISYIGSHCLGLNLLFDQFLEKELNLSSILSKLFIGSSGGLNAVINGEADICGIHLYDAKSKSYNLPFVEPYIKELSFVRGYTREIGFLVHPRIKNRFHKINDLIDTDIVFLNRNPGSGTRILFDSMLDELSQELNVSNTLLKEKIIGYHTSVKSHTAVGIQIRDQHAHVALGLKIVAEQFDLIFIPIINEHFDFVARKDRISKLGVKKLVNFLQDRSNFKNIEKMTGYKIEN